MSIFILFLYLHTFVSSILNSLFSFTFIFLFLIISLHSLISMICILNVRMQEFGLAVNMALHLGEQSTLKKAVDAVPEQVDPSPSRILKFLIFRHFYIFIFWILLWLSGLQILFSLTSLTPLSHFPLSPYPL